MYECKGKYTVRVHCQYDMYQQTSNTRISSNNWVDKRIEISFHLFRCTKSQARWPDRSLEVLAFQRSSAYPRKYWFLKGVHYSLILDSIIIILFSKFVLVWNITVSLKFCAELLLALVGGKLWTTGILRGIYQRSVIDVIKI